MPRFRLAHLREQGQDMLLFALEGDIGVKSEAAQADILEELELRSHQAGLAGHAVILWRHGGHTHFMGPRPWHPFLRSISLDWVQRNLNREISW